MQRPPKDAGIPINGVSEEPLPAIPGKVDLNDLKSNGKLLSDDEIARIRNASPASAENEFARVSKKDLKSGFSVIQSGKNLYAVYKGGEQGLGKGQTGAVKLAQNLETGKWVALKIQEVTKDNLQSLKSEYGRLQQAGQAVGESGIIESKSKKSATGNDSRITYQILMDYVPGVTIDSMLENKVPITPENRIQIGVNSLTAFSNLNQNGVLHGDIHGGNVLIDKKTLRATPIDFGRSSTLADKEPDVAVRAQRTETKKMANMMVNLYGFAWELNMGVTTVVEDAKTDAAKFIPDPVARKKMAAILTELYKPDAQVSKAIEDMKKLKLDYSYQPEQAAKVALVNVNEVSAKNPTFMNTLKQFDQVVLMDNGVRRDDRFYASARAEIEKQGVAVNDSLFRGNDMSAVATRAMDVTSAKFGSPSSYFHVTATDAKVNNAQIRTIKLDSNKPVQDHTAQVQDHSLNMTVSPNDKAKVEKILNNTLEKLQDSRSSTAKISATVIKQFISEMKDDKNMNYNTLDTKLESLGKQVGKTGIMKHVFNAIDKQTPAQKAVGEIKDAFTTKALAAMRTTRLDSIPEAVSAKPSRIQEPATVAKTSQEKKSSAIMSKGT